MAQSPAKLLLCHPDLGFRQTLEQVLTAVGYTCICCDAADAAASLRERPQAILLAADAENTATAISQLRAAHPVPVLLLRSPDEISETELTRLTGVERVLTDPDHRAVAEISAWSKDLVRSVTEMTQTGSPARMPTSELIPAPPLQDCEPACIAIGISTGGPAAFGSIWTELQGDLLPPILVVQHMPKSFLPAYAERLDNLNPGVTTRIASHGMPAEPGHVYLAPGERHMIVQRNTSGQLRLGVDARPAMSGHRPSADRLFHSLADLQVPTLGVIMTGMGSDGAEGLLRLHQQGCHVISQDEASSVVYGMPGAAEKLGCVDRSMALDRIVPYLNSYFHRLHQRRGSLQA